MRLCCGLEAGGGGVTDEREIAAWPRCGDGWSARQSGRSGAARAGAANAEDEDEDEDARKGPAPHGPEASFLAHLLPQ